jgi:DNA repair exonuclease SbcCD ATPase subunit
LNYFNYFTEIEETFIRRRGRNLLLSPLDWALIETWQERGIPLRVILRGIEQVFDGVDKQPARKRSVKSLFYCREEIEAQYAEWLESQVGKNGNTQIPNSKFQIPDSKTQDSSLFADEAIVGHLEKVSAELESAKVKAEGNLHETLKRVLHRLAELKRNVHDAKTLEESLEKLDALIDDSLLQTCSTENLKNEIVKELASYKNKMDAEVYRRTFDLMILKRLREQTKIPRLSLFYL